VARAIRGFLCSMALAAIGLGGCDEKAPTNPTFAQDVLPIFHTACVRCHGAGGTLNADPSITGAYKGETPPDGYLDHYDNIGDCTVDPVTQRAPASCGHGARDEAGKIKIYLRLLPEPDRMPPTPSPALSPWQLEVVDNWLAEMPPSP
jgi:hypothetical protein